jgi:hypothetical protein
MEKVQSLAVAIPTPRPYLSYRVLYLCTSLREPNCLPAQLSLFMLKCDNCRRRKQKVREQATTEVQHPFAH